MNLLDLKRSATLIAAAVGLLLPAWALDATAPFGFAWGPVDKVPKPSAAFRDVNVTVLVYRRDRLPIAEMADAEMVLLDVCRVEGLQQVSWVSKALSESEAIAKFAQVVAEGVRKYGESKPTSEGALAWENGRTEAISVSEPSGNHRILMVSRGPNFYSCSAEHDAISNQSLRARWLHRPEIPNVN